MEYEFLPNLDDGEQQSGSELGSHRRCQAMTSRLRTHTDYFALQATRSLTWPLSGRLTLPNRNSLAVSPTVSSASLMARTSLYGHAIDSE